MVLKIYFAVDKRVEKFKTMLEERLGVSFDQDEFSKKIRYDNNKQVCLHAEITALDPNGAAERAYANFDLFLRFYRFLGNRDREWIHDHCLVKDENDNVVFPHIGPEKYFYSQDYDDKTLGKNSERIITKLIENTGGNDFFRIDKIIRTHNTALASSDIKNAFLNLWSILEIIGVDEYGADQSKIKQVLNNVVPILKRNYLSRVVEEIHDYLKANISQDEYAKVIGRIEEEGSEDYKIACLVSLEKYADLRKEISGYLGNYPLIRSRICQLYEDILKNKKKYCAETDRYERRLRWHIQRLYRVRNQIIHSGDGNDNMVYLVEHLHSYVDEVILDIIDRTTRDESLGSVANVLLDAQVFSENFNKGRTKDKEFTAEEITYLLQ